MGKSFATWDNEIEASSMMERRQLIKGRDSDEHRKADRDQTALSLKSCTKDILLYLTYNKKSVVHFKL